MTGANRDPRKVQAKMDGIEEYQAPPREHEQASDHGQPPPAAGDPVDLSRLAAQPPDKPDMSETKPHAAKDPKSSVSGKDEQSDPANPRAIPPGERM